MIYVTGGVHGDYDKYLLLLEKLKMQTEEKIMDSKSMENAKSLFVLGNILGEGFDGIKILRHMMYRSDIFPILGRHEYFAKTIFPSFVDATTIEECTEMLNAGDLDMFKTWLSEGGTQTIVSFLGLSKDGKQSVIDFLEDMPNYDEFEVKGKKFVLVGAGIDNFEIEKELDDYEDEDFVMTPADYTQVYFKDKFLMSAGAPTYKIHDSLRGKVFAKNKHVMLNVGMNDGERMAVIGLDALKIYYI
ncbi:MAG: hypothetical protein R3Y27_07665 [Clostridia bacterium]